MRYREIPPPPGLEGLIHCLWHLDSEGHSPVQPVVPDGRIEIVVHLREPFGQVGPDGHVVLQQEVMVGGQLTRPIRLQPSTEASVIGIRLTPAGAGALLPVREITDRVVPLRAIRRTLADRLLDTVTAGPVTDRLLARVARALGSATSKTPNQVACAALSIMEQRDAPVCSVASELRVSARTLERHFHAAVGVAPVMMRRIVRFRRAFALLSQNPRYRAARVAASAGYYDESHLIREFRRFAGTSPRRFFGGTADMAAALLGGESA